MDFAELQQRINRHVQLDLGPLYESYRADSHAQGKADTMDGFLSFLAKARVIDVTLLKELHADGAVEIPRADDPAFAGTQLGDLMQGQRPAGQSGGARSQNGKDEARFQPLTRLGQGAMGAIDVARDLYLRRRVALKTVLPEMAAHPQLLGRFLTEMQITAQLEHPNVVPVYALEVGGDGTLGYAMKLVHGKDLAQIIEEARARLARGEPIEGEHGLEARMEVFLKVCDALEFAHAKGIVHRDLKPSNIMVGRHNEVYLMDWGIARPMGAGGQAVEAGIELHQADGQQTTNLQRTRLGSAIGTPSYMSPEQAEGRNAELDGRSDQYSMGLILQECWTMRQAVFGTTLQELITKAKEARRDPIEIGLRPGNVPREIEAIIQKATSKRPADRYPSVKAMADDVRRYLRDEAVSALPDSALRKLGRWVSKHRTAAVALMLAIALLGAGATIATLLVGNRRIAAMHKRELRVSEHQTESAIAAQLVDRELARYEVALSQFVGAAQLVLQASGQAKPPFFAEDFGKPGGAPADLAPSKRYGRPVSLEPAAHLLPGVQRDGAVRPLGGLAPAFRELLVDTSGINSHKLSPAEERKLLSETGVPAYRATLVLTDGTILTFPGTSEKWKGDPRRWLPYVMAQGRAGLHWAPPVTDGGQLLLPVSSSVYVGGELRGVATLEVSLDRLLERPGTTKLDYVQSELLVARDGKIIAEQNTSAGRAPLAPEILEAISNGKSGTLEYETEGRRWMASYYPLATLDWYYVSVAEHGQMMKSEQKAPPSDPRKVITGASARAPVALPAASPQAPTAPRATASAADEPDAGPEDAGPPDAGAPDAGLPPWARMTALPRASASAPPVASEAAPPPPPPTASASAIPKNPFDKWEHYQRKKEQKP